MSDEEEIPWIWDHFGSEDALFEEFLKGPDEWGDVFNHWVVRHIANELVDVWLEEHDQNELIRKAAEFMECHSMNKVGDPDADEMVALCQKELRRKRKTKSE